MNLEELRRKAEAGTKGFWPERIWTGPFDWPKGVRATVIPHGPPHLYNEGENPQPFADAEHIAAFRPDVALALLDRIEAYEKVLRKIAHAPFLPGPVEVYIDRLERILNAENALKKYAGDVE